VVSFYPNEGRLTVVPKQTATFFVRVPGFAPRGQVAAWRNGKKATVVWSGDYVTFAAARKGEELTVTYPLVTFDQKLRRASKDYTFHWKGNLLTGIEPMDGVWPLFQSVPYPIPAFKPYANTK
jgi:hypothetical protein